MRISVLIFSLPLLLLSGLLMVMAFLTPMSWQGWVFSIGRLLVIEFMAAVFVFCMLILVWALAMPSWSETYLKSVGIKEVLIGVLARISQMIFRVW